LADVVRLFVKTPDGLSWKSPGFFHSVKM